MQHQFVTTRERPSRAQIEPAALELLSRHSAGLLATARKYSATPEDAEDAYQRGVEILLTKAPTTTEDELLPWLKTVVKHEAFAVAKSSGRALPSAEVAIGEPDADAWTDERAERYEQLRVGAEAMAGLKPQEIRCLLLKAEGLSYQEICDLTGWTYTKVNRCLTEGRRSFLKRVAGIESGAECERLAPLISKVADGEASADEMRLVRPHLKGCLACKATLREYRAAPARLAGLVPPVVALASAGGGKVGLIGRFMDRLGDVGGAKLAAVALSAVVLAGGGAAGIGALHHDAPAVAPSAFVQSASGAGPASADPAVSGASGASTTSTTPTSAASAPDPSTAAIQAVDQATSNQKSPAGSGATGSAAGGSGSTPAGPEFDPGTTGTGSGPAESAKPNEFTSNTSGSAPAASTPAPTAPRASAPTASGAPAEFGP